MEDRKNIFQIIGLAARARRLVSGEETCERTIKSKKAKLCIVAEDASLNTKKKFENICGYRGIEIVFLGSKDELGKFTGKDIRSVIAVTDEGFSKKIKEMLDSDQRGGTAFGKNKNT